MGDIRSYLPLWGQWNIDNLIGESENCKVYRAVREGSEGKELSVIKHYAVDPSDGASQCERKARSLLALADKRIALRGKPNLAEYYDRQAFHRADGGYDVFVRMEQLTSLRSVMGKTDFSEAMLSQLGQELCTGLMALEDAGTCHGAIHPGNIFLSKDGSYKLGDYCRKGTRTVMGPAREYLAPEVLTGSSLPSADADRYSIGMVIYRLSNGLRGPFLPPAPTPVSREDLAAAERRRLHGEALPAPADADGRVCAVLQRACAYAPQERYSSTDDLMHDFLLLQDPDAVIAPPEQSAPVRMSAPDKTPEKPKKQAVKKKKKKNSAFAVGIVAAVIALAAFGIAVWQIAASQKDDTKPQADGSTAAVMTAAQTSAPETEAPATKAPETTAAPETTTAPETTAAPTYAFAREDTYEFVDFEIPASGYIIEDSDSRYITADELSGMTRNQCRLACNEIYARHGRIFKSETMADYFGAMPWYEGTVDGSYFDNHLGSYLTDIERANAKTIIRYEESRGWQ